MTKLPPSTVCLSKHPHPSFSESDYCNWLLARKRSGEIRDFKYIGSVDLHVNGKLWRKWAIDFKVIEKDDGGYYATPTEAAKVYNRMAKKIHGKFALLNPV